MAAQHAAPQNPLGYERIGKLMLKFSIPTIISFLINAVYNIVDQVFLGQGVGMLALSATNVAMPLVTICTATSLLLGVGAAANFNLKLGQGDKESAGLFAGNALTLLAFSGVAVMALTLVFLEPLLVLFGATGQSLPYAMAYTRITALGIPFQIFGNAACQLIRADGSPRYSMVAISSGAIFNLVFDPIFLFVFDMGIEGIALATTLGFILTAVLATIYLVKGFHSAPLGKKQLRPQAKIVKRICALGAASCINQLAMTLVQIVANNVLRTYGATSAFGADIPIAVVGSINKINIIFVSFSIGISQGCQPIWGYNYGAGNFGRVRKTIIMALISGTCFSTLAFFLFQLFPRQIMSIFGTGSEEYFAFATMYLRIFMFLTFANAFQPILSGFFSSIGKAQLGALLSLTRQVLFLIPLMVLLPRFFGIEGAMYAGPVADGAAAILAITLVLREIKSLARLEAQKQAATQTT